MGQLPVRARVFLLGVVVLASAAVAWGIVRVSALLPLAVLALTQVLVDRERQAHGHLSISLGSIVPLAAIPLIGMSSALLVALPAKVLAYRRYPRHVAAFNIGSHVLEVALAGALYQLLRGGHDGAFSLSGDILPLLGANFVYLAANVSFICTIIWFANGISPKQTWASEMRGAVLPHVGYGLFGSLLYVLWDYAGLGPFAALFLLLPLQVARWTYLQAMEQQQAYDRTVAALIRAVETKDHYTRGHSERVSAGVGLIADRLRMPSDRAASLRYAGLLHDVGKLGVPTRVLQKSERLDADEFAAIKMHPLRGLEMVREIEFLQDALAGIMHHHERIDGRGYPMGLQGEQIPEFARAIAVADAFDSMTSTRSYRGARTVPDALAELSRCAGTQFDPAMVEAFVAGVHEHGWESPSPTLPDPTLPAQVIYDHDDIAGNDLADSVGGVLDGLPDPE